MRYCKEEQQIEMSVGELCMLAYRGGDIDTRNMRGGRERMVEGMKIHKKLQGREDLNFVPELPLSCVTELRSIRYSVLGRADGVTKDESGVILEEYKTVGAREFYSPPLPSHLAQMKCYAYFLCESRGLAGVNTRLIYYNVENDKIRSFDEYISRESLYDFYISLLMRVENRAQFLVDRGEKLLPSMVSSSFPYGSVRAGQEQLIKETYRTIIKEKKLFAQAPTGIGKTMSTVYPSLKSVGEGYADKVFYLTAKASTRKEAYNAAGKIFESGGHLRTVVLSAKEQVCASEAAKLLGGSISSHCNPDECEFARGYYDRADHAIFELLSRQNGYTRNTINEVAQKYRICPYELSLDLSEFCDLIICDYNYVFDPFVYLRRYFEPSAVDKNNYVFLIDEAHNLASRAQDMYSASLSRRAFEKIYARIDRQDKALNEPFEKIILSMRALKKLCRDNLVKDEKGEESGFYIGGEPIGKFNGELEGFLHRAEAWCRINRENPLYNEVSDLCFSVRRYLRILEFYDEKFKTYIEIYGGDTQIKLFCLDPSRVLSVCMNRARSSVMFSATLTPLDYFADVLGGDKNDTRLSLPSPFPKENLCVVAVDSLSTRYEDRDKSYKKITNYIAATVSSKKGNYIVYFPSYNYMEKVLAEFRKRLPNVTTVVQEKGMNLRKKEEFLNSFRADEGILRVGFCVLGGSFSEGVDLPGSRLIGSIIVGVGIPGLSNERNIMRDYFESTRESGYDYAYTYPGMNNVLQAAGRVIRNESDRGVVVLIDDRYATEQYKHLFPEQWSHLQYARNPQSLAELTEIFWKQH